jgi:hypothetical protein
MRTRIKIVTGFTLFLIIIFGGYFYNNFFMANALVGAYKLVNKNNSDRLVIDWQSDTIYLLSDGKFTASNETIKGIYKISSSSEERTRIEIEPTDESPLQFMPINTYINRGWYGQPRIMLDDDLNIYYIKIR